MAKAIDNKEIQLGIINVNDRIKLVKYPSVTLLHHIVKEIWKTGIATANPEYYNLVNTINNKIEEDNNFSNEVFYNQKDFAKDLRKSFWSILSNDEKEYIKNNQNKNIYVIPKNNSFPVFYNQDNKYDGILYNLMNDFNKLTNIKVNYVQNNNEFNELDVNKKYLVKEDIEYYKSNRVKNIIYRTNLVIATLNNKIKDDVYINLIKNNKADIGTLKGINLNDKKIFRGHIKYYENPKELINALKKEEIDFIILDKTILDYYSLGGYGINISELYELNIPCDYYLKTFNKNDCLSGILEKVYEVYYMELNVDNGEKWNNVKDYVQKQYIKSIYNNNKFYKYLVMFLIFLVILAVIIIIFIQTITSKEKNLIKKLNVILDNNENLDVLEIDLRNKIVTCTTGLLFKGKKTVKINDYLKIINISYEDYLTQHANSNIFNNNLEYCSSALINGEKKYFKEYVYLQSDKKIISVVMDITDEVHQKNILKDKLKWDGLTGLINRQYYGECIKNIISQNPSSLGVFLFIDINDFKKFNDTYNHNFGDKVINTIAAQLKSFNNLNSVSFRISGDEFGFYTTVENKSEIDALVKKISKHLTIYEEINRMFVNISCSIGASIYGVDSYDIKTLKRYAEFAMYVAKRNKGDISQFSFFDKSQYKKYLLDKNKKGQINKVINDKEYYFVFQPIVDIKTKKLYGVEGLTRIKNKSYKGVVDFLEFAKALDKEDEASILFTKSILEIYAKNKKINKYKIFINSAINNNTSVQDCIIDKNNMENIFKENALDTSNIVLEISERKSSSRGEKINKFLEIFKNIGVKVAIDDFGEGYSNDGILINLRPDLVKLDRLLISNIDKNKRKMTVTSEIVTLLKKLNIKIIAEGVETKEEFEVVKNLGIDFIQGFYFQKPCEINYIKEDFNDIF